MITVTKAVWLWGGVQEGSGGGGPGQGQVGKGPGELGGRGTIQGLVGRATQTGTGVQGEGDPNEDSWAGQGRLHRDGWGAPHLCTHPQRANTGQIRLGAGGQSHKQDTPPC